MAAFKIREVPLYPAVVNEIDTEEFDTEVQSNGSTGQAIVPPEIEDNDAERDGIEWIHRNPCLAHLAQLAIKDSLGEVDEVLVLLKKINGMITWFFANKQQYGELCESTKLSLVRPCVTRWNSTYHCLKRLLRWCGKHKVENNLFGFGSVT